MPRFLRVPCDYFIIPQLNSQTIDPSRSALSALTGSTSLASHWAIFHDAFHLRIFSWRCLGLKLVPSACQTGTLSLSNSLNSFYPSVQWGFLPGKCAHSTADSVLYIPSLHCFSVPTSGPCMWTELWCKQWVVPLRIPGVTLLHRGLKQSTGPD